MSARAVRPCVAVLWHASLVEAEPLTLGIIGRRTSSRDANRDRVTRILGDLHDLLAAPVLSSASAEDLAAALDVAAEQWDAASTLRDELLTLEDPEASPAASIEDIRLLGASDACIGSLAEAFELSREIRGAFARRVAYLDTLPPWDTPDGPMPALDSDGIYPAVALAWLEHRRGLVAMIALNHLATFGSLAGWLPDALAAEALRGARATLRVIASLPGSAVPDAVCPPSERFDWGTLRRQAANYAAVMQRTIVHGRASGLEIWPPLAPRSS